MNDLLLNVSRLESLLKERNPPAWSRVLIVENSSIVPEYNSEVYGGYLHIPRTAFIELEDYAGRFDEILDKGYSWVNMSALGILGNALIVEITLPNYVSGLPRDKVSVNFSGPSLKEGKPKWNISENVKIID